MPKVHIRAAQCAHVASMDTDTYFIVDTHGPRWALTSSNNQAMIVFKADIVSMDDFQEDVAYEICDVSRDMLKACSSGVVVISIRANKISFTHDYDQLIRRVSDIIDEDVAPFYIPIGDSKSVQMRYDHWKRMMPMLKTDVVRVDVSPKTVTFSADDCGAACACTTDWTDTFQMNYTDWNFLYERWPTQYSKLTMGVGENGVLYISCDGVYGFMSPVV